MTPRSRAWTRGAAVWALAAGVALATQAGCDPRALFYFLQPFEDTIAAPCPSLKGKKVVVLVHAATGTQVEFQDLDQQLARKVGEALKAEVKRVEVVSADKVRTWVESHPSYTDPAECGRDFDADAVIFLEVEHFQIQDPRNPGMFEGHSKVHVQVHELKPPLGDDGKPDQDAPRESEVVFDVYDDTDFPVQGPIPASPGVNPNTFRKKFFDLVVSELSWNFVPHAPGDNIQDTNFEK